MKTHPAITHPALRHRMAQALNQLRHAYVVPVDVDNNNWTTFAYIMAYRHGIDRACERMATLEQALDNEQEARIFG